MKVHDEIDLHYFIPQINAEKDKEISAVICGSLHLWNTLFINLLLCSMHVLLLSCYYLKVSAYPYRKL